jgi:long-chain acyl-CoA synthetase
MASTLKELMDASFSRYADQPAIRLLQAGTQGKKLQYQPMTYGELGRRRDQLAAGLARLGILHRKRMGILTDGGFEPLLVFLATDTLGACAVPLCNKAADEILRHNIIHSQIEWLVVDGKTLDVIRRLDLEKPPRLILTDGEAEDVVEWDEVMRLGEDAKVPEIEVDGQDESKILYTSGSSGMPKGVIQTHDNIVANLEEVWDLISERQPCRMFKSAPDYHSMGILNIYFPLAKGWILDMGRSPDRVLSDIRLSEPQGFLTVPLVLDKVFGNVRKEIAAGGIKGKLIARAVRAKTNLARGTASVGDRLVFAAVGRKVVEQIRSQLSKRVGANLELLIVGSAKADPEALDFFQDVLEIKTFEGYGTTECAPLIAANHLGGRKVGTVGRPLIQVKLVDAAGRVVAHADPAADSYHGDGEQIGEVWACGRNVMRGYLDDPERSAEALVQEDGKTWYRTGDLFSMDAEGFLTFRGRVGRQFKLRNGEFINPELLERVFSRAPLADHVVVWGDQSLSVPLVLVTIDAEEAAKIAAAGLDDGALRRDPEVQGQLRRQLLAEADLAGLPGHERPQKVVFLPEALDEEKGTLTRGLKKVVPKAVVQRYREFVDAALAP